MLRTIRSTFALSLLLTVAVLSCGIEPDAGGDDAGGDEVGDDAATVTRLNTLEEFCSQVELQLELMERSDNGVGDLRLPIVLTAPASLLQVGTQCTTADDPCGNSCSNEYTVTFGGVQIRLESGNDDAFPIMPMPMDPDCVTGMQTPIQPRAIGCHGMQRVVECRPFPIPELAKVEGDLVVFRTVSVGVDRGGAPVDPGQETARSIGMLLSVTSVTSTAGERIP